MQGKNLKDQIIINEVVNRLIERLKNNLGLNLQYGSFVFHIHEGVCAKIDFNHKDKVYTRPRNNSTGGNQWSN
jgi:hypothetical protein